jgi:ATP-binding cassette subfamily B protein
MGNMAKNKKKLVKKPYLFRVLGYYSPLKWRILFVLCVGVLGIMFYSFMPSYMSSAIGGIDKALHTNLSPDMNYILTQLSIFLLLCVINELFNIFCMFTILNYEHKVTKEQTVAFKRKLDVVPISFLDTFATGDLSKRVSSSVSDLFRETLQMIYTGSRACFFFITTAVAMMTISVPLAILVILSLPLSILTARFVAGRTQKLYTRNAAASKENYSFIDERTTLHSFFVAHGLDGGDAYDELNEEYRKGITGEDTAVAINTVYITFIQNFMYLAVTMVFGLLVIWDPVGMASQFMMLPAFLVYSQRFLSNSTVVTTATNVIQRVQSRAELFFGIMDYPDDVTAEEDTALRKIDGDIVCSNVVVPASPHKEDGLNDISFTIKNSSSVAFVGDNDVLERIGELLAKFCLPQKGEITVDGISLAKIKSRDYYSRVGVAFEEPFIFDGTVADNLLYGVRKILPEYVTSLAKLLHFDDFITSLPQGYESRLTPDTVLLTNPEKQAINLMRMILQSPDVLILSNAVSYFDVQSEQRMIKTIIDNYPKRTKVFISKRLPAITDCDVIYFCQNGRVIESGSHFELLKQKGAYYKAYTSR